MKSRLKRNILYGKTSIEREVYEKEKLRHGVIKATEEIKNIMNLYNSVLTLYEIDCAFELNKRYEILNNIIKSIYGKIQIIKENCMNILKNEEVSKEELLKALEKIKENLKLEKKKQEAIIKEKELVEKNSQKFEELKVREKQCIKMLSSIDKKVLNILISNVEALSSNSKINVNKFFNNIYMPVSTIFEGINLNKTPYRDILLSLSSNNIVLLEEVKAKTMYMSRKKDIKFLKSIGDEVPTNIEKSWVHEVLDEVKRKEYSIQEYIDLKQYINFEEEKINNGGKNERKYK